MSDSKLEKEIKKLKSVLLFHGIVQCNGCKEYSINCESCDICDNDYCSSINCIKIIHKKSMYLSGTKICENCLLTQNSDIC